MRRSGNEQVRDPRSGFTLVELMIVALLTTIVLGATYQVLVTNQRVYTAQREQVVDHETVRAGLDVLTAELREVSPRGGDILDMDETSIEVRVMRSMGFICLVDATSTPPRFTLRSMGGSWEVDDAVVLFADNNPMSADDDLWLEGTISNISTGQQCPDGTGDRTRIAVQGFGTLVPTNLVHPGAPVRTFETYRYGLMEYDGQPFLGRRSGDRWDPLVGPLAREGGLVLEYFDEAGDAVTDPEEVRRIDVSLRTSSEARGASGERIAQFATTSIYARN